MDQNTVVPLSGEEPNDALGTVTWVIVLAALPSQPLFHVVTTNWMSSHESHLMKAVKRWNAVKGKESRRPPGRAACYAARRESERMNFTGFGVGRRPAAGASVE